MEQRIYKELKEKLFYEKLSNGLDVFILPKKGFYKTFATFTTKFGSIDTKILKNGSKEAIQFPDGIAHFLEHKMFEDENGDVFHTFAKQGAIVNAYTNFTRTAYTLSATSNIDRNLISLLDFVQHPYFTNETVEKERSIIEQEIQMYNDNPDWRSRFALLENMFWSHPVKNDIAGTISTINKINVEDLYTCYKAFYHPTNMALFIVGNVNPEDVLTLVKNNQENKVFHEFNKIDREFSNEKSVVKKKNSIMNFTVQSPKVYIGFKDSNLVETRQKLLKYEMTINVLLELMFGQSSEAYEIMYSKGLINETFSLESTIEDSFGFSIIGGDSNDPEEVIKIVSQTIENFKKETIKQEDMQRAINKEVGNFLSALNSPQYIANQFTRYHFNNINLFDSIPILQKLTIKDLKKVLNLHFSEDTKTTLIVQP
ncbi:EF-P 5-aminopentanol modification-associated protein YfmH [Bacillus sp. B1-b2]|uniref:EF-P 5-aminopentanol modification-associated protein YfmH n=1 Tax=Bacillus sp. B1-b2 TaxID=2653201 RepID=UPI0012616F8C|nr:pitrilysin family protein [Bacillus sp. B1-b2]KAB7672200.1 insulinase family protein [Bacillus sp. B1-b2]